MTKTVTLTVSDEFHRNWIENIDPTLNLSEIFRQALVARLAGTRTGEAHDPPPALRSVP